MGQVRVMPKICSGLEPSSAIYVAWFDTANKAKLLKARVTSYQAAEISCLVVSGAVSITSLKQFVELLFVRHGVYLHYEELLPYDSYLPSRYSSLRGLFLYGRVFMLTEYSRHGQFCETAFGELNTVSLSWHKTVADVAFSVLFCS